MGPHLLRSRLEEPRIAPRRPLLVPEAVPVASGLVPPAMDRFLDDSRVAFAGTLPPRAWAAFDDDEPTVLFSVPLGPAVDAPEPLHFRRTTAA